MKRLWSTLRRLPSGVSASVALLALLVSAAGFVANIPLYKSYYSRARLVVTEEENSATKDVLGFDVLNNGSAPATSVALGILVPAGFREFIVPFVAVRIVENPDEKDLPVRHLRLEIDRINPGKRIFVSTQFLPKTDAERNYFAMLQKNLRSKGIPIPQFSFIQSDQGDGEFRIRDMPGA
jgi:hypothetical protein